MHPDTLGRAVDLALAASNREVTLLFYGGEPLLEFPLVGRAVDLVMKRRPLVDPEKKVQFSLITNGTLLDENKVNFLATHDFDTQLSFDGVPLAQEIRGIGTFAILDRTLDRLRTANPSWFRERLSVSITLSAGAISHLADSFEYLVGKGVGEIGIGPVHTNDPGWTNAGIAALDHQFCRISRVSKRHYLRTGRVPLVDFRKTVSGNPRIRTRPMCNAVTGEALAVDVDGQLFGCAAFANSFQAYSEKLFRALSDTMSVGDVRDPALDERRAAFPLATRRSRAFNHKENKYSSYGRCAECRYFSVCVVCPASIGHIPENEDFDRVSDFQCAYNLVLNKHREAFPQQDDILDVLRGDAMIPELMQELRHLVGTEPSSIQ